MTPTLSTKRIFWIRKGQRQQITTGITYWRQAILMTVQDRVQTH